MEKILLVTGASSDVGMELIKSVYGEYDLIYAQYRTMSEKLESTIDLVRKNEGTKTNIIPICADLSVDDDIDSLINSIKENGPLPNHIVHLPAPKLHLLQFHKDSVNSFDNGWNVSVRSIVKILQAFIPAMSKAKYGRIVFMLSSNTIGEPASFQSSYTTIKYALLGLMKSLAVEYKGKGIMINAVSPGMMETKFLSEIPELVIEQTAAKSKTGKNVTTGETARVIKDILFNDEEIFGQNIEI